MSELLVVVAEEPTHCRHRDDRQAAWTQEVVEGVNSANFVLDVFEDVVHDHDVSGPLQRGVEQAGSADHRCLGKRGPCSGVRRFVGFERQDIESRLDRHLAEMARAASHVDHRLVACARLGEPAKRQFVLGRCIRVVATEAVVADRVVGVGSYIRIQVAASRSQPIVLCHGGGDDSGPQFAGSAPHPANS